MSYTPNTWATGDTITAEKLNNIEQGIANAGGGGGDLFIVKIAEDETTGTLMADKNYNEINAAVLSGIPVVGVYIFQDGEIVCDAVLVNNSGATFTGYLSEVSGSSLGLTVVKFLLSKGSSGTSYNVAYNEYTFTIS